MLTRWIPWQFFISRAARHLGLVDPATVLARVRSFSQPSEVKEPIELLRSNILFQARGLINTRAIQFNLDWAWPYWVERQFNPADPSFVPRAVSATHVNITHRDWSSPGSPEIPCYPLVDPRGLVTPLFDGWSLDFWLVDESGPRLLPSKINGEHTGEHVRQSLDFSATPSGLAVKTVAEKDGFSLTSSVQLVEEDGGPACLVHVEAQVPETEQGVYLVVSVRPYNMEGVQFVEEIDYETSPPSFLVNGEDRVILNKSPERRLFSAFHEGDVLFLQEEHGSPDGVRCKVGMATGAAYYAVDAGDSRKVTVRTPMTEDLRREFPRFVKRSAPERAHGLDGPREHPGATPWETALAETAQLEIPDARMRFLYDSAVRTLLMLSANELYPGPFTYRRFWFRDAAFMLRALMAIGHLDRSRRHLQTFPSRQKRDGYFRSQEGEWDSNGQVLWAYEWLLKLTGEKPDKAWVKAAMRGAEWITQKRTPRNDGLHGGLLPAGFSAEHLGPNDFYFWDDYWGVAGFKSAAGIVRAAGMSEQAATFEQTAEAFLADIDEVITRIPQRRARGGIPASPYRRLDAGAIGSMVADYPLHLTAPDDPRIQSTLEFILANCFFAGGFFQDMVHSGVNIYLTLDIAQTLLRMGDPRFADIVRAVAGHASPTGHWPEAVHPFSGGGCMGDGQHGWAAAEWIMMIRSLFIREEADHLVLGAGLLPEWTAPDWEGEDASPLRFGPTPTPWGPCTLSFTPKAGGGATLQVQARWRGEAPRAVIAAPGCEETTVAALEPGQYTVQPAQ